MAEEHCTTRTDSTSTRTEIRTLTYWLCGKMHPAMIRPNSLTLPPRIGHTESLAAWWNWQHAVFRTASSTSLWVASAQSTLIPRSQFPQQHNPSSTHYFLYTRNATSSAEPAQIVLTIQSHRRAWMPLLTLLAFYTGPCLCLRKPID